MTLDRKRLLQFQDTFMVNRQLTYDLLASLNDKDLSRRWPRPGLDTFAKHFEEMAVVERAFSAAISSGTMDFSAVPDVFEFTGEKTKQHLRNEFEETDRYLSEQLSHAAVKMEIDWDGTFIAIEQHLVNLVSHEVFHQGMMAMAIYLFALEMPKSWVTNWALPPSET